MCGIVGMVSKQKNKKEIIKQMTDKIEHRGPNEEGYYVDENIALGHRRLSIIDLNNGKQPMFNEDKTMVIIFNGEIYNFQELKNELIKKGHQFKTGTDTEAILHGYEEYKEKIVNKLRGMFAFVIYNRKEKLLFGARDIFGIKPLYYTKQQDCFLFASEIKAFLPNPDFHKELNRKALKTYLTFQYNPLDETFFKEVYKLKPGSFFIYQNSQLVVKKYFEIEFTPKPNNRIKKKNSKQNLSNKEEGNGQKLIKLVENIIEESIKAHTISDVKLGLFLSSGIDSSYIASVLKPNQTFTVGFETKGFNEIKKAKELSNLLEIENINKIITADEFFEVLPKVQYYSDEPHANLSSVPLYFLSRLAKQNVAVIISGEGADELFGGYESYKESLLLIWYKHLPQKLRKNMGKLAKKMPPIKGKNFLIKGSMDISEYYIGQACVFKDEEANSILTESFKTNIKATDITKSYFEKVKGLDDITKKQYVDMFLWLPNDILLKADKMSMAHGIEIRVPYLDKEVYKIAKDISVKNKKNKEVLRKAASNKIPREWFKRHKKGFLVPFKKYLIEEKYYKIVRAEFESEYAKQFFYTEKLVKMLEEHYYKKVDNGRKIYNVYSFLLWYKEYFLEN